MAGTKCRALLDTGSGSSYASAKLVEQLNKKPSESKVTRVEMLMGSATRRVEIFNVNISNTEGNFNMETKQTKVEKPCLIELPNPHYDSLIKKYPHLGGVKILTMTKRINFQYMSCWELLTMPVSKQNMPKESVHPEIQLRRKHHSVGL